MFKKNCAVILSFLLILSSHIPAAFSKPELSLSSQEIQRILNLEENRIDLLKELLSLSQKASRDLLGKKDDYKNPRAEILRMSKELKKLLKKEKDPHKKIEIINQYLFQDKFKVDRSRLFEGSVEALLLGPVVTKKKGHCLSLSLIYLCLAERLNLPVHGVTAPGHFFVCYQDENFQRNIETTDRGSQSENAYYLQQFSSGHEDPVSLRNLTKKEVLAVFLSNIAINYKLQGKNKRAIEMLQTALKIMPENASFYTNLGNSFERDGNIRGALFEYQKALSINPYLCEAHYNLGLLHYIYTGYLSDAFRHGNIARRLGCRLHPKFRSFLDSYQKAE